MALNGSNNVVHNIDEKYIEDPIDKDYPDARTLLISSKRPCSFLERAARELLAGGTDIIILSALGDAITLAVQLQNSLEEKNAANQFRIRTTYNQYKQRPGPGYTAGIKIYMKKHPDFKGSRISPGFVSFYDNYENNDEPYNHGNHDNRSNKYTPVFDKIQEETLVSLNGGDYGLYVGGGSINAAFATILKESKHDINEYKEIHQYSLNKVLERMKNEVKDIRAVEIIPNSDQNTKNKLNKDGENEDSIKNKDVKLIFARSTKKLLEYDNTGLTGFVCLSIFNNDKKPYNQKGNIGMLYVVGPDGRKIKSKDDFLNIIKETASNIMTTLCDYNGYVRREKSSNIERITNCRVALFSGGIYKHQNVSKEQVATQILAGLESSYRHGPSPRLNFAYDNDAFHISWKQLTGLSQ